MSQFIFLTAALFLNTTAHADIFEKTRQYETRYQLTSLSQKLVNNTGDGFEELYGVRNFRAVLRGVLYRGGANNAYNKYQRRDNQNPLPNMGLKNLCEEGFSGAVYLYDKNFATAPKHTVCKNLDGDDSHVNYRQLTATNAANLRTFLQLIYDVIKTDQGPLYMHCWNGWHASGLVSALALRQFCGMGGEEAVRYWEQNTDGHHQSFSTIKRRLREFRPLPDFSLTAEEQRAICL